MSTLVYVLSLRNVWSLITRREYMRPRPARFLLPAYSFLIGLFGSQMAPLLLGLWALLYLVGLILFSRFKESLSILGFFGVYFGHCF